ncbi:MAG TPA: SRPBCC family protein [Dermatophilaceae bacterium]|nr:SRPBCC family protein [Dermatophilaceae bacterium]
MRLQRIVTVEKPLEKVFAYLADFTTTTEWDPGTVRTVRTSGDGGFGTEYHNTTSFAGRQTELTYVVVDLVPNRHISLRGENKTVIANDTMTFRENGGTTEVTYTADFTFKGITRFIAPLSKPAFTRLFNEAETGMASALARL